MSPEVVSLLILLVILVIATVLPINMGALGFGAAFLLGTLVLGLTVDDILANFPAGLFLTLAGITYVTGDGASIGPTTSLGGPYPEGDITHTYTSAAAGLGPFIQVEYGGDVSVDGGEWITIPATATASPPRRRARDRRSWPLRTRASPARASAIPPTATRCAAYSPRSRSIAT